MRYVIRLCVVIVLALDYANPLTVLMHQPSAFLSTQVPWYTAVLTLGVLCFVWETLFEIPLSAIARRDPSALTRPY